MAHPRTDPAGGPQGRGGRAKTDLISGDIFRSLVLFSIPIVLANLLQQVYSMVDLAIIGQYVGSVGTVGVSTGSEVMDFLTPVATALAGAGQVYISQLFGARENEKLKEAIGTLITVMLLLSVVFCAVALMIRAQIVDILNCPESAREQALSYLCISVIGLPFVFGYNGVCAMLRGIGESKRPLYFILIAAVVNIFLDLLLVAAFRMEAAGTAIATVVSQAGAFLASFHYLYKRRERFGFQLRLAYFRIDRRTLGILLRLGIPKMFQALSIRGSLLWCQANINTYGLVASATNSVGNKMQKLCTVFVQGIDAGAGAMIGQNLGAQKHDRVKQIVWKTFALTMSIATVGAIMALLIPTQLFGIFTKDPEVLRICVVYMRIMAITYYSAALLGPFQAVVTGCGFASLDFLIGMMDGVVCRIGLSALYAFALGMGVNGFFLGNATARIIPAVVAFAYFMSGHWAKRKLLVEK